MTETIEEKMCQCGKNPAQPPHACPFQSDVNNDEDYTCDCCGECEYECAMDI